MAKIVIKITTNRGKILNIDINPPAHNIVYVKPDKIANKRCPAVILADNRTPKDIAFANCETNSIITKKKAKTIGDPEGIIIAK